MYISLPGSHSWNLIIWTDSFDVQLCPLCRFLGTSLVSSVLASFPIAGALNNSPMAGTLFFSPTLGVFWKSSPFAGFLESPPLVGCMELSLTAGSLELSPKARSSLVWTNALWTTPVVCCIKSPPHHPCGVLYQGYHLSLVNPGPLHQPMSL